MLISKEHDNLRPLTCPHCGAVSCYVTYDRKKLGCWQGHSYPAKPRG